MSIRKMKRKKGEIYVVEAYITPSNRLSKSFYRKIDAENWEKDMILKRNREEIIEYPSNKIRLHELAEQWLEKHAEVKKAPSSIKKDKQMLLQYIYPEFGSSEVKKILPENIDDYVLRLKTTTPLSNASINRHLALMKTIFNSAIKKRFVKFNPVSAVEFLRENKIGYNYWTQSEVDHFLNSSRGSNFYLLYFMALKTGMRIGELMGLKWKVIDFENNMISVEATYDPTTNRIKETTKDHEVRYIGISKMLYTPLLEASIKNNGKRELVFGNEKDNVPSTGSSFYKRFYNDVEKAGVKKITFHGLRHTFASIFMINGGRKEDLQRILGHGDPKTTDRYIHLEKDYLRNKIDIIDKRSGHTFEASSSESNIVEFDLSRKVCSKL